MKKTILLTLLLSVILNFQSRASHLMGGDLTLYNNSSNNYTLTLQLYRDIQGIPLAVQAEVDVFTWDVSSSQYLFDSAMLISENTTLSTSLLPLFPYGVEVGIYTVSLTLPTGNYQLVYNTSARNAAIINATNPSGESLVLYTNLEVFSSAANSTPSCLVMPVAYFPINSAISYNPLPYDADGDSLTWQLNTPIGGETYTATTSPAFTNVVGFTTPPSATSGPFTMNSVSGEITWTPNALGNYIQSFEIDEYRSGIHIGTIIRDMQYVIVSDSTADSLTLISASPCLFNSSQNYNYVYYSPGQPFTFQMQGVGSNTSTNLTMTVFGSIMDMVGSPATFNTTGSGNNITGTLSWTPPTTFSKDVIVVFRLSNSRFMKDYTVMLRKDPNTQPSKVVALSENQNIVSVYPNPLHNNINIFLALSQDINGDISLYSALGQKVASLYTGPLSKGTYNINKQLSLPAGAYQLVIKNNGTILNTQHVVVE